MELQLESSSASSRLSKYLWQYIATFIHDDEEKEAAAAAYAGGAGEAAPTSTTATATMSMASGTKAGRRHQRCHDDWSFVATFSKRPLRWNCWMMHEEEVAFLSQSAEIYYEFLCSSGSSNTEREPFITSSFVGIPRIIHHIWLGSPLPAHFQELRMTWIHHHPEKRGKIKCVECIYTCKYDGLGSTS